jgi:hypothetical protein
MSRLAFVATYLTGTAAAVILLNANISAGELALAIWAIASVLLGWGSGQIAFALLAFLAIPFAVPFGYPDNYEFSEPMPIWWSIAVCAFFSAGLILISALLKLAVEARRHGKAPPERGFSRSG